MFLPSIAGWLAEFLLVVNPDASPLFQCLYVPGRVTVAPFHRQYRSISCLVPFSHPVDSRILLSQPTWPRESQQPLHGSLHKWGTPMKTNTVVFNVRPPKRYPYFCEILNPKYPHSVPMYPLQCPLYEGTPNLILGNPKP